MTKARIFALCIGTLLLGTLAYFQPLRFIDNLFYDLNFRLSAASASDMVAVAAIDEKSIGKIGAMPWPRSTLALLMDRINACSPKAVAVDILFPKRDVPGANDSLAAAFSHVNSLVLPFKAGHISDIGTDVSQSIPSEIFNFRFLKIDNQEKLPSMTFYSASEIVAADTLFTRFAKYGGFLNVSTSVTSQKLREAVHVIKIGDEYFPSLALSAVAAFRGLAPAEFAVDGSGAVRLGSQRVPLTSYAGTTFINFRKGGITTVSASDILDGTAPVESLKGKLVFIGVTDPGAGADFFITPAGPQFPGVCVWATAALDVLEGR
jgi:adenylate cyclase